jgi:hypothetical protein
MQKNNIPNKTIRNLVVFSIIMENNDGILGKAPSYIAEKFVSTVGLDQSDPERLLDHKNKVKYAKWLETWEGNL